MIWPDRTLTETTADGGVLFTNVPPGRYTLRAHKQGAAIRSVAVTCRAGVLTNASPPWGLQVEAGGLAPDETVPFPTQTTTTTQPTAPSSTAPVAGPSTSAPSSPTDAPDGGPADPAVPIPGRATYAG